MTAEELWSKHFNGLHWDDITPEKEQKYAINFAKLKCQELLEIVAENVKIIIEQKYRAGDANILGNYSIDLDYVVNRNSILNAVNLDDFIK